MWLKGSTPACLDPTFCARRNTGLDPLCCAPPTPWFPLACLPRVSVAAQRTNLPDKPTLSIHAQPIKAAHSQNMPWEVSFYWNTRHVWESAFFVLLRPSA